VATAVGLFDTIRQAETAVRDLVDMGIPRENISVIANNARGEYTVDTGAGATTEGAAAGAIGGTVVGGALGLLVGLGALAIPGIGPVLAVGPLAAAVGSTAAAAGGAAAGAGIGAAAGGLLGALVGAGVPEEEANYYTEGVRRGGTLVSVSYDGADQSAIADVLRRNGAVDIDERGAEWRRAGWTRFDPASDAPSARDWEESSKVGTATGTAAGAATGAAIGAVGGPVGAVVGGLAGAATGAAAGAAGDVVGERAEDDTEVHRRSRAQMSGATEPVVSGEAVAGTDVAGRKGQVVPHSMRQAGEDEDLVTSASRDPDDWEESSKVGTATGTAAGAATGAAIGAVGGPVGAVVGGLAGAATGAAAGAAGDVAGERAEDELTEEERERRRRER
jgi:hypothetical protein